MPHRFRKRVAGLLCVLSLTVLGGSTQLNAQEIGSELLPEGVEMTDDDREALEEMYEFFANSVGMTFDEARAQGLSYTELEQLFSESSRLVEQEPGSEVIVPVTSQLVSQESTSSGPALSFGQRRVLQVVLLLVFGCLATVFNWVRDSVRSRSAHSGARR